MSKYILFIGRVLFSLIFIIKGAEHFSAKMVDLAIGSGVPMAQVSVPLFGIISLLGGLSVLFGYKARIGAWGLVVFLLPTAIMMHPFWAQQDAFASMMHQYCFWKNISMLGAALMITHFGSGPCSFDKK